MEEVTDKPKWLLELENRKRKPRLAHEAGAGAQCLICTSACPGLDLHFWRKICKNCKCGRDDHDVDDDDYPQFELLFGQNRHFKKKPILLHVGSKKQHDAEAAFEWVPPDTTKELAADYMKALPAEKLPIKGSAGAVLRRQLLQKQLPLHDVDHKACDALSEDEKKQFEKYLENIKKYVGQGRVTKMLAARPFDRSLMTPANAADMQRSSPQHKLQMPASGIQLRTPSSFNVKINKGQYSKLPYDPGSTQDPSVQLEPEKHLLSNISNTGEVVRSTPIQGGMHNFMQPISGPMVAEKCEVPTEDSKMNKNSSTLSQISAVQSSKEPYRNPATCLTTSEKLENKDALLAESILADALLPPSAVHTNDIVRSTLDEKRLSFIREKLNNKYGMQEEQVPHMTPEMSRNLEKTNANNAERDAQQAAIIAAMKNPSGGAPLTQDKITEHLEKIHFSPGHKPVDAESQTHKAMPSIPQFDPSNSVLHGNVKQRENFVAMPQNEHSTVHSGIPQASKGVMTDPKETKQTSNNNKDKATVQPSFRDLSLQTEPNKTGSLQHELNVMQSAPSHIIYSESLENQIFPHDAIEALNQSVQNVPNTDQFRQNPEESVTNAVKLQKCHKCKEEIRVGDVVVTVEKAKNESWHPGCFCCSVCQELLVDLVYFYYKGKLYCGRDLANLLGIPRCFACDELIFVREYTVAEGHNYHVKHFCCWDCDVPLAGQQYISENDRPLCLLCYQKTYAKTCNACNVVIAADQQGVAVKNLNFHANETCFSCYTCKKSLLNGRMAIKEDRPFCSKECISKFLTNKSSA